MQLPGKHVSSCSNTCGVPIPSRQNTLHRHNGADLIVQMKQSLCTCVSSHRYFQCL